MAFMVDHHEQQSNFKHFCKICKKGFGCGRALGGHMRAHGIGDEAGHIDDDDPAIDWEDKHMGANNVPPTNKHMYALRTNPNRLKSCKVCGNCGREFSSWKSFLEHGKCSSDDAESLVSSPVSDGEDGMARRGGGWSKRKRSLRTKVDNCLSSEDEDLANCLMMLSNAAVDPLVAEPEESCASASKEEERRINTMNFISPIVVPVEKAKSVARGLFECKACKKVFNSHQALGGHRASHKKVKGCFASRLDHTAEDSNLADEDHDVITHEEFLPIKSTSNYQFDHGTNVSIFASTSKRKSKVHECSICHRVFSSGQALGGHKRCHWITSNSPDASSLAKFNQLQDHVMEQNIIPQRANKFIVDNSEALDLKLDLNLPAPHDQLRGSVREDAVINQSSLDDRTAVYLQPWIGTGAGVDGRENLDDNYHQMEIENNNINEKINYRRSSAQNVDDEADSKVKLAKLSELKDMTMSEGSSPWLQVGIGSTTDVGADG